MNSQSRLHNVNRFFSGAALGVRHFSGFPLDPSIDLAQCSLLLLFSRLRFHSLPTIPLRDTTSMPMNSDRPCTNISIVLSLVLIPAP